MTLAVAATLTLATPNVAMSKTFRHGPDDPARACSDARHAIRWYRARYNEHRHVMGASRAPALERHMGCRRARVRARYWVRAAYVNRVGEHRWSRTIHARPDWQRAALEVQRPYPGTYTWLMSCSAAEGGHGAWVWYGGRHWQGYHIGNDYLGADTVGGWMQFRYSTFAPYWRHATEDLTRRGYQLPELGHGRYDAWLAPIGQAITAAYMRFYGKDGWHWSASGGRGC